MLITLLLTRGLPHFQKMVRAILLDIEGTTTPISFVHETLFPYARERVGKFVETHFTTLAYEINQLVDESSQDASYTMSVDTNEPGSIAAYLEHLIDQDRKSTPLKSIQGQIWDEGFRSGEIIARVFEDVPTAMKRWTDTGKVVAIYSSGSILAQKLLFAHTNYGDLTPFISNYFATTTGPKRETASYTAISEALGIAPAEILFLSDIPAELDAARDAGVGTTLSVRPGNNALEGEPAHTVVTSFDAIG